jgi:hypothetical protein
VDALGRSAAARGVLRTGGTLKDILDYGQAAGTQQYEDVFRRRVAEHGLDYQTARDRFAPEYGAWQNRFGAGENRWQTQYGGDLARWQSQYGGNLARWQTRYGGRLSRDLQREGNIFSLLQGNIASRGAARSGEIWGNVVNQIGNIAAGTYAQHQERKSQEQRQAEFNSLLQSPEIWQNKRAAVQAFFPMLGEKTPSFVDEMWKLQEEEQAPDPQKVKLARENLANRARVFQGLPDYAKSGAFPGLVRGGINAGLLGPDEAPESYIPEEHDPLITAIAEGLDPAELVSVTNVDPEGRKTTTLAPEAAGLVTTTQEPESLERIAAEAAAGREPIAESAARVGAETQARVAATPAPSAQRAPERESNWGTATTDAERKRIAAMSYGLKKVPGLKEFLKKNPDVIGPIEGRMTKFRQKWGVRASEEIAKREAELAVLRNAIVNALSGVAVNPQEFERLKEQIPNIEDSEQVFKGKMVILEEYFQDNLSAFGLSGSPSGGGGVGTVLPAETQSELDRLFPGGG